MKSDLLDTELSRGQTLFQTTVSYRSLKKADIVAQLLIVRTHFHIRFLSGRKTNYRIRTAL